jgi:phosphoribosyl 1,2-cyclic phosphate phosphodiesterase
MRFHILGSSAGKTVPRPFCRCHVCEVARQVGGRHVRTRCAVHLHLADDESPEPAYGIDLSPESWGQLIGTGLAGDRLAHLLITHAHADHLDPQLLGMRGSILSDKAGVSHLSVYGSDSVGERLAGLNFDQLNASWHSVTPFEPFAVGALQVVPLLANHGPGTALNYIVQHLDETVLLAWDTGYWGQETWEAVADFRFTGVISECTIFGPGPVERDSRHLNFATLVDMKQRLTQMRCIDDQTPWATLHIGDNGGLTYDEQVELATPHGVTVGYDGMSFALQAPA